MLAVSMHVGPSGDIGPGSDIIICLFLTSILSTGGRKYPTDEPAFVQLMY